MDKNAWVLWQGGIKDDCGSMSKEAGVPKETLYGFNTSFNNVKGTNTDELMGAAPAVCFSMAQTLETHTAVTLNKVGDGYEITISLFRSVPKRTLSLVPPK